jgi:AcrR family transcriptional regulator
MDTRTKMLEAAETLLDASPDGDISTRAVCEAVGVGAPVLYRLFGDKAGLLSAVVDHGFDRYLATKRAAEPSEDPVADLRSGWDTHVAFAREHPTVYRLMYSPSFSTVPSAATEALRLLREVLDRCAAAGRLRVDPQIAAQTIMAANVGVALSLVTQPERYADPDLSSRVRDAVHARLLVTDPAAPAGADVATSALQLSAQLRASPDPGMTGAELSLLLEWLARLAGAPGAATPAGVALE